MTPAQTNVQRARQIQHARPRMILHACPAHICRVANAPHVQQTQYVQAAPKRPIANPDITKITKIIVYPVRDIPATVIKSCAVVRDIICMATVSA